MNRDVREINWHLTIRDCSKHELVSLIELMQRQLKLSNSDMCCFLYNVAEEICPNMNFC